MHSFFAGNRLSPLTNPRPDDIMEGKDEERVGTQFISPLQEKVAVGWKSPVGDCGSCARESRRGSTVCADGRPRYGLGVSGNPGEQSGTAATPLYGAWLFEWKFNGREKNESQTLPAIPDRRRTVSYTHLTLPTKA